MGFSVNTNVRVCLYCIVLFYIFCISHCYFLPRDNLGAFHQSGNKPPEICYFRRSNIFNTISSSFWYLFHLIPFLPFINTRRWVNGTSRPVCDRFSQRERQSATERKVMHAVIPSRISRVSSPTHSWWLDCHNWTILPLHVAIMAACPYLSTIIVQ